MHHCVKRWPAVTSKLWVYIQALLFEFVSMGQLLNDSRFPFTNQKNEGYLDTFVRMKWDHHCKTSYCVSDTQSLLLSLEVVYSVSKTIIAFVYSNRAGQVFRVAHVEVRGQLARPGSHLPPCCSRLSKARPAWQQASLSPSHLTKPLTLESLYLHCIINIRRFFVSFLFVLALTTENFLFRNMIKDSTSQTTLCLACLSSCVTVSFNLSSQYIF